MTAMLAGPLPRVATGPHCSTPYECPFTERCWPVLPPHHVSTLYAMRRRAVRAGRAGLPHASSICPRICRSGRRRSAAPGGAGGRIDRRADPGRGARSLRAPGGLPRLRDGRAGHSGVGRLPSLRPVPVQFSAYVPDADGRPPGPRLARGRARRPAPGAGGAAARRVRGRPRHRDLRELRPRPHPGSRGGAAAPGRPARGPGGARGGPVARGAQSRLSSGLRRPLLAQARAARAGARDELSRARDRRG